MILLFCIFTFLIGTEYDLYHFSVNVHLRILFIMCFILYDMSSLIICFFCDRNKEHYSFMVDQNVMWRTLDILPPVFQFGIHSILMYKFLPIFWVWF